MTEKGDGVRAYSWRAREAAAMLERYVETQIGGDKLVTLTGPIYTERGIVTVRSVQVEGDGTASGAGHTVYRFVRRGRYYVISENRARSKRPLIRMATRLIRGKVKLVAE
jgi:hypothetical protein